MPDSDMTPFATTSWCLQDFYWTLAAVTYSHPDSAVCRQPCSRAPLFGFTKINRKG